MLNKDLDYYKNLEYNIIVDKQVMDNTYWYIAYSIELGKCACYGQADTYNDAIYNFIEEKDMFIEYLFNEEINIPEPNKIQ